VCEAPAAAAATTATAPDCPCVRPFSRTRCGWVCDHSRAPIISRDANTGAGQDFTGLAAAVHCNSRKRAVLFGHLNSRTWEVHSAFASRPFRVASIAAMQRSLKPQSTGQHRGDPPFSRRCGPVATGACRTSNDLAARKCFLRRHSIQREERQIEK